jgi:hypothetical protein
MTARRTWAPSDLSDPERRIADRLLWALFDAAPGSVEEREALTEFDRFDAAITRKYRSR